MLEHSLSPRDEMLAYEVLVGDVKSTPRVVNKRLLGERMLPSQLLARESRLLDPMADKIRAFLGSKRGFSVTLHGDFQFPEQLLEAKNPSLLLYYRGNLNLVSVPSVSVVGARDCSREGAKQAARIGIDLAQAGFAVVSGLAKGIDTAALAGALAAGGSVIGVIGTPIDQAYPKQNAVLQDHIAEHHLLISQVPFYRHKAFGHEGRYYFPARNETMAAISHATVIVEASDKSGTLTQARAALAQTPPRQLFILESCFQNPNITWPRYYEERGAIRVKGIDEILQHLPKLSPQE